MLVAMSLVFGPCTERIAACSSLLLIWLPSRSDWMSLSRDTMMPTWGTQVQIWTIRVRLSSSVPLQIPHVWCRILFDSSDRGGIETLVTEVRVPRALLIPWF